VNGLTDVFRVILEAAAAIKGRQLVLSIGSNIQMDDIGPIPANAIVVSKAPQIELLKRAELCKWLESAFPEKQAANWKNVFMHSTRVPVAPQASHG
jgi:hypothetical protein